MFVDLFSRARASVFRMALVATAGMAGAASASTLLILDVTDPGAITITATGAAADANATVSHDIGFSLKDFFTGPTTENDYGAMPSSSLTAGTTDTTVVAQYTANGGTHFNLFFGDMSQYVFSTSSPAFQGSAVADWSAFASLLPAHGATGRIAIGDGLFQSLSTEFGDWEVVADTATVPLPAGLGLLLAGGGALLVTSRRRRKA